MFFLSNRSISSYWMFYLIGGSSGYQKDNKNQEVINEALVTWRMPRSPKFVRLKFLTSSAVLSFSRYFATHFSSMSSGSPSYERMGIPLSRRRPKDAGQLSNSTI